MPLKIADRVQVTATANTTASFSLGAVVVGFRNFSFLNNDDTTYYAATDSSGNYEVGIGTFLTSGTLLNRTTILASSSTPTPNVAVTFSGTVNVFVTLPSSVAVITSLAQTLTNKRITPRVTTSTSTVTPNADTDDQYNATALGSTATIAAPTGTPTNGQRLTLRLVSGTSPTTLTWVTTAGGYVGMGIVLPTSLVTSTYIGCIYNSTTSKWDVTAVTGPL
jgi:hypothetical protein